MALGNAMQCVYLWNNYDFPENACISANLSFFLLFFLSNKSTKLWLNNWIFFIVNFSMRNIPYECIHKFLVWLRKNFKFISDEN